MGKNGTILLQVYCQNRHRFNIKFNPNYYYYLKFQIEITNTQQQIKSYIGTPGVILESII